MKTKMAEINIKCQSLKFVTVYMLFPDQLYVYHYYRSTTCYLQINYMYNVNIDNRLTILAYEDK